MRIHHAECQVWSTLCRDETGSVHLILYTCRALSSAESNYITFKREALGDIVGLTKLFHYLARIIIEPYIDHQELNYEGGFGVCERWMMTLPSLLIWCAVVCLKPQTVTAQTYRKCDNAFTLNNRTRLQFEELKDCSEIIWWHSQTEVSGLNIFVLRHETSK